jgi:hypothetical protein
MRGLPETVSARLDPELRTASKNAGAVHVGASADRARPQIVAAAMALGLASVADAAPATPKRPDPVRVALQRLQGTVQPEAAHGGRAVGARILPDHDALSGRAGGDIETVARAESCDAAQRVAPREPPTVDADRLFGCSRLHTNTASPWASAASARYKTSSRQRDAAHAFYLARGFVEQSARHARYLRELA